MPGFPGRRRMIDVKAIWETLPHRYPFLLVDRVLEMEGDYIHAIKNVTINEEFFKGHFPGNPIMPGVLIIEALAQAGGILALRSACESCENKLLLFRGIENAKFRKPVVPGDQLHLHATRVKVRRNFMVFECKAMVDGEVTTEAELSAVIEDVSNEGGKKEPK